MSEPIPPVSEPREPAPEPLLQVDGVGKRFGGLAALLDVDLTVPRGGLYGLIGPNGSGKSTLFNVITGFYRPDSGGVHFAGAPIAGLRPEAIASRGLVRTFQLARPFGALTVWENLLVAAPGQPGRRPWRALFGRRSGWTPAPVWERARELLELTTLNRLRDEPAADCSYGQQKLLALACAVMARPQMLMLDEPMAGVNPTLGNVLRAAIRRLRAEGMTFLIVEHDMGFVMEMCERVVVLDHGVKIAEGAPDEVRRSRAVIDAYLGG